MRKINKISDAVSFFFCAHKNFLVAYLEANGKLDLSYLKSLLPSAAHQTHKTRYSNHPDNMATMVWFTTAELFHCQKENLSPFAKYNVHLIYHKLTINMPNIPASKSSNNPYWSLHCSHVAPHFLADVFLGRQLNYATTPSQQISSFLGCQRTAWRRQKVAGLSRNRYHLTVVWMPL